MRLINTQTLKLVGRSENRIPQYAILPHRWGKEEVLLKDCKDDTVESASATKPTGLYKIKECCERARVADSHYVWVDNCCIDRSSSAELSESTKSMYDWYSK